MAGSNERELKLKLTIEAPDPSKPAKAFQDIAAQANRASLAVQDAQKHMQRMQGGPGSGHGLPGGGVIASAIMGVPQQQRTGWASPAAPSNTAGSSTAAANQAWVADRARVIAAQDAANHFNQLNYRQYWAQSHMWAPPAQQQSAAPIINPRPGGGGGGGGDNGGNWMASAGRVAGMSAATLGLVGAASNLVEATQQLDNKFLTAREKLDNVYKSIPVIGNTLAGIADGIINAVERIKDPKLAKELDALRVTAPRQMYFDNANARRGIEASALIRESRSAGFAVDALREFPSIPIPSTIGMTAIDAKNTLAMADAKNATARGARESRRASMEEDFTRDEVRQQRGIYAATAERERAAKARYDAAENAARNPTRGGGLIGAFGTQNLEKARLEYQVAMKQSAAELARLESAMTANKEKQLAFIQKESEYRKLATGEMKVQLGILQEEAARSRDASRSFGAMDSIGQRGALDAIERFKKGGRDYVSGSELSVLQQLVPDLVNKDLDKANKENPLVKEFLKAAGMRDEETINKEIGKLEAKINMSVKFDEEETAKSLKKALEKLNLEDLLGGIVNKKFKLEVEQFRIAAAAGRS